MSPWGYKNGCFSVGQCHLIVRRPIFEEAIKRYLHQQVKILGSCSAMWCMEVCYYSCFWWIFLRWCGYFWGVICYDRWVLSGGHKNYFKDRVWWSVSFPNQKTDHKCCPPWLADELIFHSKLPKTLFPLPFYLTE